jgi:hypothetical protein
MRGAVGITWAPPGGNLGSGASGGPGTSAHGRIAPPAADRGGFEQPNDAVLIAVPTVYDARHIFIDVMEQVEVVTDEFHLEQSLVDRDRDRMVELLPHYKRTVALHLYCHNAVRRYLAIRILTADRDGR